jgi:hypothetical protein
MMFLFIDSTCSVVYAAPPAKRMVKLFPLVLDPSVYTIYLEITCLTSYRFWISF